MLETLRNPGTNTHIRIALGPEFGIYLPGEALGQSRAGWTDLGLPIV